MTRVISAGPALNSRRRRATLVSRKRVDGLLLRRLELQGLLLELLDGPAVALVDLLGELPGLEPLHHAALHQERLTREGAVLGGEVPDERRHVSRVPRVELGFVLRRLHDVLQPGSLLGETRAGGRCDRVRTDAVPAQLE